MTQTRRYVCLENKDTGEVWRFELPEGATFTLGFTHSVMKTGVEEVYAADRDDGLVLQEVVYQSYGVGLPFLPEEGELVIEDGKFILRMEREIGELHMTVSPLAHHWIAVDDGRRIMMEELLGSGSVPLLINIQTRRVLRWSGSGVR